MTSIIKVDNLQNQCGANIISESANVITIGASGDTVTLAAGASQSGFGRSGSVNWDTTPKTTTVTAVSGNGYFINTTSGGVTVNLPAGTAGAIVALSDYAATWNTNAVTVNANGTEKIGGVASAPANLNTRGQAVTLVYVDSTRGWINTGDATAVAGNSFIIATGGTITTSGDYKIHTFTGPGTFTVTCAGTPTGSNSVEYLVVAGGGGGGKATGGGGGAGGFRQNYPSPTTAGLPVTATSYPITVGGGGNGGLIPASPGAATSGNPSIFSTITSAGGGFALGDGTSGSGGSGGGASYNSPSVVSVGGTGNTPPVSPPQGNNGGGGFNGPSGSAGGGGGASAAGGNAPNCRNSGPGGAGTATLISGSSVTYAGGGGGGLYVPPGTPGTSGNGGVGGGGGGSSPPSATNGTGGSPGGQSGTGPKGGDGGTNTGGGGGGGAGNPATDGGNGGSGIVVIRYKFQ